MPRQLNILLVNTCTYRDLVVYPIGLDYIKSFIEQAGFPQITCLDLALVPTQLQTARLAEVLAQQNFDVIGLSFRNVTDQLYQGKKYAPLVAELISFTRSFTQTQSTPPVLVVGGAGFSLLPERFIDELGADYGIAGEGEAGFLFLLEALQDGRKPKEKVIHRAVPLKEITYQRGSWGHVKEYQQHQAWGNLQSKRGCNRKCIYCSYPVVEGRLFRLRNPELVALEAKQLQDLGFENLYFVDATFNNPLMHAKEVLKAMVKHGVTLEWKGFFNPDIDQELLDLVKATNGGKPLKFTIESGSNQMLKTLQKGFTTEYIERAVTLCQKNDLPYAFTIMFGGPGETLEMVNETCQFIKRLQPENVTAGMGVFVYPQTTLAEMTKQTLWSDEKQLLGETHLPIQRQSVKDLVEASFKDTDIEFVIYDELEYLNHSVM